MLQQPKNRKYRKDRKNFIKINNKGIPTAAKAHTLQYGCYGLKALECCLLKATHIESVRRVLIRDLRKIGNIWIRIFPSKPITSKPLKTRMGKGKGSVQYWAAPVKAGQILFEISGSVSNVFAQQILLKASQKLPIKAKFIGYNTANTY